MLAANPTFKITEVAREVGVLWKLLEEDEKTPYEERVVAEKERYMEQVRKLLAWLLHL